MWPLRGDFTDAVQNPDTCFVDPFLRECDVERYGPARKPKPRGGAFATVFKLEHPTGRNVALRVFDGQALTSEKEQRLIQISAHLSSLGAKRPDYLMEFEYLREGILVKGGYYPTLKMEFVDGVPLGNWYQSKMAAKDFAAVKAMAEKWQKLVIGLRSLSIAHGDLQHGNVMVRRNDTPVLVDYDGMCVPGLVATPPLPCFEFGLPGYVHPGRSAEGLHYNLDHFPAWIILIALRASAADPALYRRFVEDVENENMLFCPTDISDPGGSKLWPELLKSPDPEVKAWAADLRASIDKPFNRIPPFQTDPNAALTEVCSATPTDWEAIQAEADRLTTGGKPLPNSLHPNVLSKVATAKKKVASRAALRAAFAAAKQSGDPRGIAAAFDPAVYTDWAKHEGFVKQITRAIAAGKLLTELEAAAKASPDGKALLAAWDRTRSELEDWSAAQNLGKQAESWRARIEAADYYLAILTSPSTSESAIASAWNKVAAAGTPHPSLSAAQQERGRQAPARAARLADLKKIPFTPPGEKNDQRLISLWDEALLGKCSEAASYPARVAEAKTRLAALAKVVEAVRRAEAGAAPEAAIVAAAAGIPQDYEYELRTRVARSREGEEKFTGIKNLLDQAKPSDMALAAEWEKFKTQFPNHVPLLDAARRERCEQSLRRRNFLRAFDQVVKQFKDPWEQDREISAIWTLEVKKEMAGSAEMDKIGPRIKLALVRLKSWERLEEVLRIQDIANVKAAFAPPLLSKFASYPPVAAVRPQVDELIRLADWLDDLRQKLEKGKQSPGLPITPHDFDNLRRYGDRLDAKTREDVLQVLRQRLWPEVRLAASSAPPQVMPGPVPMAKVRWTWNGAELVSWFEVATAPGPLTDPSAAARDRISRCRPADHAREGGGRLVVLGPGGSATITIWPVLDLGWSALTGPPIHIGPVRSGR
jgi:hypothetical protein